MSRLIVFLFIAALTFPGCIARKYGTTVVRDEDNPCLINMVIQIGINGTDADVDTVRSQLEDCYNKECFIPCDTDSLKGCKTKITVIVKKWSTLNEEEQRVYHYVNMIDNDGQPSNAFIGTPNRGTSSGTWRRNADPNVYCHEVLHLCGLKDQYCSRLYDPVKDSVITELNCESPPDPDNGNCCTPNARYTRCGSPCTGHEHDLMASLQPDLSCENIRDVLKIAGMDNCPESCCTSGTVFAKPPDEAYLLPGYLHFGDKNVHFGSIGVGAGYTKYLSSSLGVTLDAGIYSHLEKEDGYKQTSRLLNITAGVTWLPGNFIKLPTGFRLSTHALAGISGYTQKTKVSGNESFRHSQSSLNLNIGAGLDWNLRPGWKLRILQVDYLPTFFSGDVQQNYKLSAGLVYSFSRPLIAR